MREGIRWRMRSYMGESGMETLATLYSDRKTRKKSNVRKVIYEKVIK